MFLLSSPHLPFPFIPLPFSLPSSYTPFLPTHSPEKFNVKAISAIYGPSHFGIVNEIIGTLETSSYVYQFLVIFYGNKTRADNLINQWTRADQQRCRWLLSVPSQGDPDRYTLDPFSPSILDHEHQVCAMAATQGMRNRCWGKEIFGVTTPSPVDLFTVLTDPDPHRWGTALAWRWGSWAPRILQIPLFRNPKGRRLLRVPSLAIRTRLWGC